MHSHGRRWLIHVRNRAVQLVCSLFSSLLRALFCNNVLFADLQKLPISSQVSQRAMTEEIAKLSGDVEVLKRIAEGARAG